MSEQQHKVMFERYLGQGPSSPLSNALSVKLGADAARPVQWAWRCSCGASGTGSHEDVFTEGRQHEYLSVPIMHVRSQDGQPYGSERRCCNHCGVMLWGDASPPYVDNMTDWRALPNNCAKKSTT